MINKVIADRQHSNYLIVIIDGTIIYLTMKLREMGGNSTTSQTNLNNWKKPSETKLSQLNPIQHSGKNKSKQYFGDKTENYQKLKNKIPNPKNIPFNRAMTQFRQSTPTRNHKTIVDKIKSYKDIDSCYGKPRLRTQLNTINEVEAVEVAMSNKKERGILQHHRSKSIFTHSKRVKTIEQKEKNLKTNSTERFIKKPSDKISISKSRKKYNLDQQVSQIRAQLLIKRRIPSNKTLPNFNHKNTMKDHLINYGSYTPVCSHFSYQTQQQQIAEKWGKMVLKQLLGRGAHAIVRLGICHHLSFAVKIYEKYKLLEPRKKKRVYKQIEILQNLPSHPNIIYLAQSFENKNQIHIIFQHIENASTLAQYFRNNLFHLSERQIRLIFYRVVRGVHHLHTNGIAHRDLKPDNILLGYDQDHNMLLKIIDFGFAVFSQKADLHCGTPNFMAPELVEKVQGYNTFAVDIWALGVILFYLCEGRYPFRGYDEKDLFRSIKKCEYEIDRIDSESILNILQRILVKQPSKRMKISQLVRHQWFRFQ